MDRLYAEAAEARAAGVRAPADRPSQRRSDEFGGAAVTRAAAATMTLRAVEPADGADPVVEPLLRFEGHASVYERAYEMYDAFGPYNEIVSAGAATETLNRADLSCPLVLDHDSMRRIAITDNGSLILSEDEVGLRVLAPMLDPEDEDVDYIRPKMNNGLITEMSFRFRITRGVWSPDYTEYRIEAFDLHRGDVSIVGYGANPYTTSNLRHEAKPGRRGIDVVHDFDVAHIR
jgi:HK97 family phage prohead protease